MEPDLRRRFDIRTEHFGHGDFRVEVILPRAADELIDVSEFNADERLPYWAELWPSARALTRHLLEMAEVRGPALELGSGIALPSLALRWRGVEVVATDYYPEALQFARANAERNGIEAPRTLLLDWRTPPPELEPAPLVIAADVLYERRNAEALLALLPRVVAPGGRVLLADPGRVYAGEFMAGAEVDGWRTEELASADEPSAAGEQLRVRVRILELRRPEASR
jgi:predicted nicotinamide N-methyase